MRLQLLSDVHLEFHRDSGQSFVDSLDATDVDVLVLAGDIAVGAAIPEALALFCNHYRDAKVVYVHGNHEFYGTDRRSVVELTRRAERANSNLIWLDCGEAEIEGRRFLGTPLWFGRAPVSDRVKRAMTDFGVILDYESWVYDENARAIAFLEHHLREGDIVVTHHLPSQRSVAPRFEGHPLNPFFVCDVERLMAERRPRSWFHGHTHTSTRYQIGATEVRCNPFGYVGFELNTEFEEQLLLEL